MGRGIPIPELLPDWYNQAIGYLPNARVGEGAIVGILRANQRTVAYNLRFIDSLGRKSAFEPRFARYKLEAASGVLEFPGGPNATPDEIIITEGLEDALSVHRVSDQPIVGLVDAGSWRALPPIPGKILVVRHGDSSDSAADKELRKGIDRQIFGGRVRPEIRCTTPGLRIPRQSGQ